MEFTKGVLALRENQKQRETFKKEGAPITRPPGFNYKDEKKKLERELKTG